jgi:hypothetical protein
MQIPLLQNQYRMQPQNNFSKQQPQLVKQRQEQKRQLFKQPQRPRINPK